MRVCDPFANESPFRDRAQLCPTSGVEFSGRMTAEEDVAVLASHLADLTRVVEDMALKVAGITERAATQQEATNAQQDRIEAAARELADVSSRLQAAADALRSAL